ncbi:TPA: hypothetical protein ACH3X2_005275 [Trebouxia sp. C0005]|nr:MAG: hypothetical protein FRX49_12284 [Trebouxia sp. A1-2]
MSSNQAGVYRGGNTTGTTGTGTATGGATELRNTTGTAGTGVVSAERGEPICDQKYYTKVEDRPIVKEQITYVREHHPMEKEFIVETRPTGRERELTEGRTSEVINTEEKIIEVTPRDPCAGVEPVGGHIGRTGNY